MVIQTLQSSMTITQFENHIWPHSCLSRSLSFLCFTLFCFSCHICERHLASTTGCVIIVWLNWFMQAEFSEGSNDPHTDCWSQHKEQAQKTTKATAAACFSTTPWWSLFWLLFHSSFFDLEHLWQKIHHEHHSLLSCVHLNYKLSVFLTFCSNLFDKEW